MDIPQTVLITGGSSGIGFALAKIFAQHGYNLVLVASNHEKLDLAKKTLDLIYPERSIRIIAKDLSKIESASEIYNLLELEKTNITILVNNAGFGGIGNFNETDLSNELRMINVNITALTQLTKYFLKDMIKRKDGKILNVGSIAGLVPGPYMAIYHATKAYVLSFSEALAEEVKGTGVSVTVLCPSATKSDFFSPARGFKKSKLGDVQSMTAEYVAQIGFDALMKGKTLVVAAPLSQRILIPLGKRLFPRSWLARLMANIYKKIV